MARPKKPRGITSFYSAEYQAWADMKNRCFDSGNSRWKDYGGRGITVYGPWQTSFREFLDYVLPRPSSDYSLDRINNNGNYEPGNVRWALRPQQQRNQRRTKYLTHNGETLPAIEWANRIGIPPQALLRRIRNGWPISEAVTKRSWQGVRKGATRITVNGETHTTGQWAKIMGTNAMLISDRIARGWSHERAVLTPPGKNGKRKPKPVGFFN